MYVEAYSRMQDLHIVCISYYTSMSDFLNTYICTTQRVNAYNIRQIMIPCVTPDIFSIMSNYFDTSYHICP